MEWRAEGSKGADDLFAFVQTPTIAADQGGHSIAIGRIQESAVCRQFIRGRLSTELPVEAEHLLGLAQG
jgi:hypothetical protein